VLRKNEPAEVLDIFQDRLHLNLSTSMHERNSSRPWRVKDPEKKRKIIGRLFIKIFEEEAQRVGDVQFLAQGTLYPTHRKCFIQRPSATSKATIMWVVCRRDEAEAN